MTFVGDVYGQSLIIILIIISQFYLYLSDIIFNYYAANY